MGDLGYKNLTRMLMNPELRLRILRLKTEGRTRGGSAEEESVDEVQTLKYERRGLSKVLAFLFSRPVLYVTVGGQDEIKKIVNDDSFHIVAVLILISKSLPNCP